MSALAPTLEAFFTERLGNQLHASPNTVAAYRDAWRLLLGFVQQRTGKLPCRLDLADLDSETIAAFLNHLEQKRNNTIRTRNARLAAIRSFFRFASLRHPEHAALVAQVLAIPTKRGEQPEISYLIGQEIDTLLTAPDRTSWTGRRDHALLDLTVETGLRVSELTGLRNRDIELGVGAHVRCTGKGRKSRCTPISKDTVSVMRTWMQERQGESGDPLFPSRKGGALSRGAVEDLVAKHAANAARTCPSLAAKHVTPHVLRTVAPWSSSAQESTAPRSPYGSATRGSRPPSEATSTPTCPSKNARSPERRHDKPHPDATGRPTGYSPFSTACKSKAIMQPLSRQNLHSARDPPRAGHNRLPYISCGS